MKPAKLLAAAGLAVLVCLPIQAGAETVLRYSSYNPLTHFVNRDVVLPWAEEVARATEGRVRIDALPKMVGTPQSQYDVVRDGLADMAFITPGYTPGRFDLASLGELPLLSDDPVVASVAFQRFFDRHLGPAGLFADVQVLSVFVASPGALFTRDRPVAAPADLQGLKLRAAIATTIPLIERLGAVPVQKPVTELYELLSTGVLDGSLSGAEQANTYNLADVARHLTIVPGGLYNSSLGLVVNKESWARISPEDQAAIAALSGEVLARRMGEAFLVPIQAGIESMKTKGQVTTADEALVAAVRAAAAPLEAALLQEAKADGLADPEAAMADYREIIRELTEELK